MKPIYRSRQDAALPLNIVGEQITVLASRDETGDYEIFMQQGPAGTGAPPHQHRWNETFYVLSGEVEFGCEGSTQSAAEGALVHIPAGNVHWFRFAQNGGRMISITGNNSRASGFFRQLASQLPDGAVDAGIIGSVGNAHGVEFQVGAEC